MNPHYEDPYKILQLDRSASIDEVKRAYYYIAKLYHPDRGGNPAEFAKFQNAFRQIIAMTQASQLKAGEQQRTSDDSYYRGQYAHKPDDFGSGGGGAGSFNQGKFNQAFREQPKSDAADGYVYNIDESDFRERTKSQFLQQHSQITAEAESVKPMFRDRFDPNVFNRMFDHMKSQHAPEEAHTGPPEPHAAPGSALIPYSDVNKVRNTTNISSLGYTDYTQVYATSHKNPTAFDAEMMSKMAKMEDIRKDSRLSVSEAQKRISAYKGTPLTYNSDPLMTDPTVPMSSAHQMAAAAATAGPETKQQNMHDKMMELRMQPSQLLGQQTHRVPGIMQYPTNSHHETYRNQNKETPMQIRDIPFPVSNDFLPTEPSPTMQLPVPHQVPLPLPLPLMHQLPPTQPRMVMDYAMIQQQNMLNAQLLAQQQRQTKIRKHGSKSVEKELQHVKETVRVQQKIIEKLIKKKK